MFIEFQTAFAHFAMDVVVWFGPHTGRHRAVRLIIVSTSANTGMATPSGEHVLISLE
jgi:hypothetical protein